MPEELTPVIREEEYLAAIAGQDVTPPDPATRKEEWLDAIAGNVDALAEQLAEAVPTPAAADKGKVLTAAEKTVSQTIMPEYSATFDEYGHASPTNITVSPASIPNGTVGTLQIGENSYNLPWTYDTAGGFGIFGELASGDPCLGYDGIEWYLDNGPTSATATTSLIAELPSGEMGAKWESGNQVLTFTDATAVADAVTSAVTAALTAGDYLAHAGSSSKAFDIPTTSGVTASTFSAAVSASVSAAKPLIVSVAPLGVFNATFFGLNNAGATAQLVIPSYDANYGFVTILLELYVSNSVFKGNVYAQQIKMPS